MSVTKEALTRPKTGQSVCLPQGTSDRLPDGKKVGLTGNKVSIAIAYEVENRKSVLHFGRLISTNTIGK